MTYLVVGVGQAGGSLLDSMFAGKRIPRIARSLAINSTFKDLQSLRNIPRSNWLGLSETHGLVPWNATGFEGMLVGGFGKDPRMAEEMIGKNMEPLVDYFRGYAAKTTDAAMRASKTRTVETAEGQWDTKDTEAGSIPFVLLMLGLGGGTGAGSAALIAKAIRDASAITPNIIAVGILPATHEGAKDGQRGSHRQAANAIYALDQLEKYVDGFILVDNERLTFTSDVEMMFPDFNTYIARALSDLIYAHTLEGVNPAEAGGLSLKVIDTRDIASAISFGSGSKRKPGYASIGWAADTTKKFSGYLVPGMGRRNVDCLALLEVAKRKQSIQGIKPEEAEKNLGLIRVPISLAKNRRFFPQTGLVEAQLGRMTKLHETHFGVTYGKRPIVSVNTLFTFKRENLTRLQQLKTLGETYEDQSVLRL